MIHFQKHLLSEQSSIREALQALHALSGQDSLTLFLTDRNGRLTGSLTDGDIRRALLREISIDTSVANIMNRNFFKLVQHEYGYEEVKSVKARGIQLIPIVDRTGYILRLINLTKQRSLLPVDAVIMAGGEGKRLRPLTKKIPKPLLQVGDKPIIEHNIDRLIQYGVSEITISIRYLGQQIRDYFQEGKDKGIHIRYVEEEKPLGTAGALSLIEHFYQDTLLVMNSDLLTNIDFEDFYRRFSESTAAMAVATTLYNQKVPYAVLETKNGQICALKEKPTYTYESNAGIYLLRRTTIKQYIPQEEYFDITDLVEKLLSAGEKVVSFPIRGYWLDIGRHEEYNRAQEDIRHIQF